MAQALQLSNVQKLTSRNVAVILELGLLGDDDKKLAIETLGLDSAFFTKEGTSEEKGKELYDHFQTSYQELMGTRDTLPEKEEVLKVGKVIYNPYEIHSNKWWLVEIIRTAAMEKTAENNPEDPFVLNSVIEEIYIKRGLAGFKVNAKGVAKDMGEYDENGKVIEVAAYPNLAKHFICNKNITTGLPESWGFSEE